MNEATRVMVDLETTGRHAGCGILSIGACTFGSHSDRQEFYIRIDPNSLKEEGFHSDADTLKWWAEQDPAVYAEAFGGSTRIMPALLTFSSWLETLGNDVEVWGNGADFDNAILAFAYSKLKLPLPWNFYKSRCYRTLKNLYPQVPPPPARVGHHVAIDDATWQADHAEAILDYLGTHRL